MNDADTQIDLLQFGLLAKALENASGPVLALRQSWEHQRDLLDGRFTAQHHQASQVREVLTALIESTERCRQLQQKGAALALLGVEELNE